MIPRSSLVEWLQREAPVRAPAWLAEQRWFGGKARSIAHVRIQDVVPLPDTDGPALVLLHVSYGDTHGPAEERYAILLTLQDVPHGSVLGRLGDGRYAVEAATNERALLALLSGLVREAPAYGASGGQIVYADSTDRTMRALSSPSGPPRVSPIGAEQSNTSVRMGSTHVFKLFRRLETGLHPELEMGRFLTRVGFRAMPPLDGSLVYRRDEGDAALGVLQGWIDSEGDGWSYVVGMLERTAVDAAASSGLHLALARLGATTAEFHLAVASDPASLSFAPEPVTTEDERSWCASVLEQARRTFALVDRHSDSWGEPASSLAASALAAQRRVAERLDVCRSDRAQGFVKIRIHGDYHLGQTLRTGDGFVILDFEGEPGKPLVDRRSKHCALKDVAGMLRSLDYAVATAQNRTPSLLASDLSADRLCDAFLDGYRTRVAAANAKFLPPTGDRYDIWLGVFELEKALYEVEYEVNNRPAWVHIPLRAVCRLLA